MGRGAVLGPVELAMVPGGEGLTPGRGEPRTHTKRPTRCNCDRMRLGAGTTTVGTASVTPSLPKCSSCESRDFKKDPDQRATIAWQSLAAAILLHPNARVYDGQQDIGHQCADDGKRAQKKEEAAGQVHVLRGERTQ